MIHMRKTMGIDIDLLKDKSIAITGATGLIGSTFTRLLLTLNTDYSLNLKIVLLVRSLEKAVSFFGTPTCIKYYILRFFFIFDYILMIEFISSSIYLNTS